MKRAEALRASLMAQVQTDSVPGPPLCECIEKYLATREQEGPLSRTNFCRPVAAKEYQRANRITQSAASYREHVDAGERLGDEGPDRVR